MSIDTHRGGRIEMSQRERDRLKVLHTTREGQRARAEAARLPRLTTRQVRRLLRRPPTAGMPPWPTACAEGYLLPAAWGAAHGRAGIAGRRHRAPGRAQPGGDPECAAPARGEQ